MQVAPKVAAWDNDYGVGKLPSMKPPELELRPPPPGWTDRSPTKGGNRGSLPPPETPRGRGISAGGVNALPEPMPPPKPKTGAQLFELNDDGEWEEMGMFDSDDLDDEQIFVRRRPAARTDADPPPDPALPRLRPPRHSRVALHPPLPPPPRPPFLPPAPHPPRFLPRQICDTGAARARRRLHLVARHVLRVGGR